MILRILILKSLFIILLLQSCTPKLRELSPEGDNTEIRLTNNDLIKGELLMVTDSAIFVVVSPSPKFAPENTVSEIHIVPVPQIKKLSIKGYVNHQWGSAILLFELLPALLLGAAAAAADMENPMAVTAIVSVPTVLSFALLAGGTPPEPGMNSPVTSEDLNEIRKYAHFPQELKVEELEQYIFQHNFSKHIY